MKTRRSILSLIFGAAAAPAAVAVAKAATVIPELPAHVARKANLTYLEGREAAEAYVRLPTNLRSYYDFSLDFPLSASECAGYAPASRSASECSQG